MTKKPSPCPERRPEIDLQSNISGVPLLVAISLKFSTASTIDSTCQLFSHISSVTPKTSSHTRNVNFARLRQGANRDEILQLIGSDTRAYGSGLLLRGPENGCLRASASIGKRAKAEAQPIVSQTEKKRNDPEAKIYPSPNI